MTNELKRCLRPKLPVMLVTSLNWKQTHAVTCLSCLSCCQYKPTASKNYLWNCLLCQSQTGIWNPPSRISQWPIMIVSPRIALKTQAVKKKSFKLPVLQVTKLNSKHTQLNIKHAYYGDIYTHTHGSCCYVVTNTYIMQFQFLSLVVCLLTCHPLFITLLSYLCCCEAFVHNLILPTPNNSIRMKIQVLHNVQDTIIPSLIQSLLT